MAEFQLEALLRSRMSSLIRVVLSFGCLRRTAHNVNNTQKNLIQQNLQPLKILAVEETFNMDLGTLKAIMATT